MKLKTIKAKENNKVDKPLNRIINSWKLLISQINNEYYYRSVKTKSIIKESYELLCAQ